VLADDILKNGKIAKKKNHHFLFSPEILIQARIIKRVLKALNQINDKA